nr:MAG TPA: hypothetical protein [Caudoviricetes sp.]
MFAQKINFSPYNYWIFCRFAYTFAELFYIE